MVLRITEKFDFFCRFSAFDIFLSTNFAENMNQAIESYLILRKYW